MSERDEQGLSGRNEQQSLSPADAGTTDQDVAISGNGGTPTAKRLGIRPSSGGVIGDPKAAASADATSGVASASGADTSAEGLASTGVDNLDASATGLADAGQGTTSGQSGVFGTRGGTDRSDIPGGLAGGMDTGEATDTGEQADASQEGANIQP